MSEATYYHVTETGLAEGVSLGRITVVLAPAYDSAVHLYLDAAERCIAAERREKALQLLLNTADQRNADSLVLVREAWKLIDGQDPATAAWHFAASKFINGTARKIGGPIESGDESEVDLSGLYAGSKL